MESMYYGFAKGKGRGTVSIICCFCGNDEDFAPKDEVMEKMGVTSKTPLPICQDSFRRNTFPPVVNAMTDFGKQAENKRTKKRKILRVAVSKGLWRSRKKSKDS